MIPLVFMSALVASIPCTGRQGPSCIVAGEVGRSRVNLLVDTGAHLTVLTGEGARRAGVRVNRDSPIIAIRGAGGTSWAALAHLTVRVGTLEERGVLVAVMPSLKLGRDIHGLLGMSYLERFRMGVGGDRLDLVPIDKLAKERHGGRGRAWWTLRFRQSQARLRGYESMLGSAKKADRKIESAYGVDPSGINMETMIKRLHKLMEDEQDRLRLEAARHAVPLAWRK